MTNFINSFLELILSNIFISVLFPSRLISALVLSVINIENKYIFAEKTYHEGFDPIRCVRSKDYKLIINFDSDRTIRVPSDIMNGCTYQSMIGKLINVRERYELYNIKQDKYERKNLANNKKYKKVRKKLIKEIFLWMRSTKDPLLFKQIKSPFFLDTIKELK